MGVLHRLTLSILLLHLALVPTLARAQPSPPPGALDAPVGVLGEVTIDALPAPDAEVWFVLYQLESDGTLPVQRLPGPMVVLVQAGTLTITTTRPLDQDALEGATPNVPGEERTLEPGDMTVIQDRTLLAARNDGAGPVVMLVLELYAPEREGELQEEEAAAQPQGLTLMGGTVTRASFPQGPGTVTIERATLAAGASEEIDAGGGAILGWLEGGTASLAVDRGACAVLTPIATGDDVDVRQIGPESPDGVITATLAPGAGFGCGNALVSWQADDEVTVLRARVLPVTPATPAA